MGSRMAAAHNLYRIMGFIDACRELKLFEVNVALICCGMVGVAPPRDGRYGVHICGEPSSPITLYLVLDLYCKETDPL
jgi:hypothetical protein